jgi:hypothetical protein
VNPADVQIPKGMKLLCTVADFCRITNFAEPEDVLNLGGAYEVRYRVATWHGEPKTVRRQFHSKTFADRFVDLLRECTGVVIESDGEFKAELVHPIADGMRLVNAYGSIEEATRGVVPKGGKL